MAILSIGSSASTLVDMPDPKLRGFTVSLQDIDSGQTTRTASGKMIRDRVVGGANAKRKLVIEWPPLNGADAQIVLQAVSDVFVYVKYLDPYTNAYRTAQFYAGDREAPMYNLDMDGNPVWEGIKYDLIEQ